MDLVRNPEVREREGEISREKKERQNETGSLGIRMVGIYIDIVLGMLKWVIKERN